MVNKKEMGKKKVKKRRNGRSPYRWLLLIPIQLLLNKVILIIGLYVDSKIMEPKPGAQGHGAPFITFFAIAVAFWLTIIITIIAIRRMIVDIKKRKYEEYEEDPVAELDEKLCLVMATENDIQDLHRIQVESFMPLYEKYHDDISPALETIEKLKGKMQQSKRKYAFIQVDGIRVGFIGFDVREYDNDASCRISPICVLPRYQNMKIGFVSIVKAINTFPTVKIWRLSTISEEAGNCHLYEKIGFVRVGDKEVVNENMSLVNYEYRRKE